MAVPSFSKFARPPVPRRGQITDRDLDILDAVLRYRFISAAYLVRLVGGNEDVTHRRLRMLWEWQLLSRWAFPGIRSHSEFYYFIDNQDVLGFLADRRGLIVHEDMKAEIANNREKDYGGAAYRGQHMQLGFLQHSLMVSRLHYCLELACRKSGGAITLAAWAQGSQLAGRKVEVPLVKSRRNGNEYFWEEADKTERLPVEPDAMFTLQFASRTGPPTFSHFFYEADRGTMTTTDMLKKLRAYHHFIKRQQKHKQEFGVHPIRAVLVETTDEPRARRLMQLVHHPLVSGPEKRAGLFWFTISPMFTAESNGKGGRPLPRYLEQPTAVFEAIWALPDGTLHALADAENSAAPPS